MNVVNLIDPFELIWKSFRGEIHISFNKIIKSEVENEIQKIQMLVNNKLPRGIRNIEHYEY